MVQKSCFSTRLKWLPAHCIYVALHMLFSILLRVRRYRVNDKTKTMVLAGSHCTSPANVKLFSFCLSMLNIFSKRTRGEKRSTEQYSSSSPTYRFMLGLTESSVDVDKISSFTVLLNISQLLNMTILWSSIFISYFINART